MLESTMALHFMVVESGLLAFGCIMLVSGVFGMVTNAIEARSQELKKLSGEVSKSVKTHRLLGKMK